MDNKKLKNEIEKLKNELNVTIVVHFYQKDEVFDIADFSGDSLQLAQIAAKDKNPYLIFCGVSFMGESVKILDPNKRVFMPKVACCAMAEMIDINYFDKNIQILSDLGIGKQDFIPITYINSSAKIKARVGELGGYVCTSSNAKKIIEFALKQNKKILFVPDRCLGQNVAHSMKLKSAIMGESSNDEIKQADIICYNGFCSVHQLFSLEDINFFRKKYPDILIASHPECKPEVCENSDFVGSTSQLINYIQSLPIEQKVAVGTEFNMVNRLREKNTYILSSTKPECPTMNETTLQDVYDTLQSIKNKSFKNEIFVDKNIIKWAKTALDRMMELSKK